MIAYLVNTPFEVIEQDEIVPLCADGRLVTRQR